MKSLIILNHFDDNCIYLYTTCNKYLQQWALSDRKNNHKSLSDESGQTLIEFILLLSLISVLSFYTLKLINSNLSTYWSFFVTKVVEDSTQSLKL